MLKRFSVLIPCVVAGALAYATASPPAPVHGDLPSDLTAGEPTHFFKFFGGATSSTPRPPVGYQEVILDLPGTEHYILTMAACTLVGGGFTTSFGNAGWVLRDGVNGPIIVNWTDWELAEQYTAPNGIRFDDALVIERIGIGSNPPSAFNRDTATIAGWFFN